MSHKMVNVHKLTPVEEHNGVYFKRDDLFQPFNDIEVNGGKLRQCLVLLDQAREEIKISCGNIVGTTSSVHSPQLAIVARSAIYNGMQPVIGMGTISSLDRLKATYPIINKSYNIGADIDIMAKVGYASVVEQRLKKKYPHIFLVKFGINFNKYPKAILKPNIDQVENLDNYDNIVLTVGSGITAAGVIQGLKKFEKKFKRLILIQMSNKNQKPLVEKLIIPHDFDSIFIKDVITYNKIKYEYYQDKTYPYSRKVYERIDDELLLDPLYEAKAYQYMNKYLKLEGSTLFWLIGNSAGLRNYKEKRK
jgi:1-aminocyclopropane-1-carboxylate deaminase/D-cysteine desulfhydrase-like pyridoxal-dependent ACC family enzyme